MNWTVITRSIRWRLLLWIAFLLVFILAGLGVAAYEIHWSHHLELLDGQLRRQVVDVSSLFYMPPPPEVSGNFGPSPDGSFSGRGPGPSRNKPFPRAKEIAAKLPGLFQRGDVAGFYFVLWTRENTDVFEQSTNTPADVGRPLTAEGDTGTYVRTRGTFREAFHTTERGDSVLVGRSLVLEITEARHFAGWLFLGSLAALVFGLGGAWVIITRALQPVKTISSTAGRIAAGKLSERINVAETDGELGQLAAILNSTFARLEAAFAQQKQFTADAAHELRTPIAVLISEVQTTLAHERASAEYRESMSACLDTAQQMRRLTESLLELARLDAGQEIMRRDRLDLAVIARDCVKLIRPLAAARRLAIHGDFAPAETVGDADRLKQVVTNLLANAVRYNQDDGEIRIATHVEEGFAILTVADTGQGISAEDLPRVFERFYRGDKSRSGSGNSGLGLAIGKAIVAAHGGTITVASQLGRGTTFSIRLAI